MEEDHDSKLRFRTIWISDLHLGSSSCQAELLLAGPVVLRLVGVSS